MRKIIFFLIILFLISPVMAVNASSSSYSVGRFGTGMITSNSSSTNYESLSLSESKGTTRNAENDNYTTNIGFFDNTPYHRTVSISSYTIYPTSAVQGSIISLSVSALNYESIWAVLTLPDSTTETITMSNGVNSDYTANSVGTYTLTFYANNSQGSLASVIDTFSITEVPSTPPQQPSGGGSSTITVIKECSYMWDCSAWSVCSNGIQTRICENIGDCTGTEGKPIEERICSDALFDVVMKLEEVDITQNNTLKFSIDLTETKGIEKIDVYIKYSIIDKNENEIFNQIETRAIQGNLTYEKEISEIRLEEGEYILRVDILYGNLQRAYAEQNFRIVEEGIILGEEGGILDSLFEGVSYKILIIYFALILGSILLLIFIILAIKRRKGKKTLVKRKDYRSKIRQNLALIKGSRGKKHLLILAGLIGIVIISPFLLKSGITDNSTGNVIEAIGNTGEQLFVVLLLVVLVVLIFVFVKKKLHIKIKEYLEDISSIFKKKHSENRIGDLTNKKVYSSDGKFIGEIKDIILEGNRISSLRIKLDKSHGFSEKGIIVYYKNVESVRDVVILDKDVLSFLED